MVFHWASGQPVRGEGFDSLKSLFSGLETSGDVIIAHGIYFRDEAADSIALLTLGKERIARAADSLAIDQDYLVYAIHVEEITSDVRAKPFEAIRWEKIPFQEVFRMHGDTLECSFPLRDSIVLAPYIELRIKQWLTEGLTRENTNLHLTGTADGSGIAESMDMAMERALLIKQLALQTGWKEESIFISTGQRNHPLTLRNRSVVLFFE